MDFEELKSLGWSENEIKVYVAVLQSGEAKVEFISSRIPLPRTTIYGVLKSLQEKGIISYVIKGGIKYFIATDPDRLISIEQEKIESVKKILPSLNEIKKTVSEKPSVELYSGKLGIKTIYEDMLKEKKPICGYGNTKMMAELLDFYVANYIQKRVEQKIPFRLITEPSIDGKKMKEGDSKKFRETKFIDALKNSTVVVYVYGDKTATITLLKQEPIAILVENEQIAKSNRVIFDLLWTGGK